MSVIANNTLSRIIRISNIHSTNPSDTMTNFTVNLNRMTETNNILRVVFKSIEFPNNAYNIQTSGALQNNIFNFRIPLDADYSHTITQEGYYTTQELIDILLPVIQARVDVIDPTNIVSMSINPYSKKIQYHVSKNTVSLQLPGNSGFGSLNIALGNTVDTGVITQVGNPVQSAQLPDLYGLTNVYIHSTTLAEGNVVDGDVENHDILGNAPVDKEFGQIVYYNASDGELESINYESVRNYDNISISLRDLETNLITLNGGKTVVTLKVYYL
jgi:hypothetical protein